MLMMGLMELSRAAGLGESMGMCLRMDLVVNLRLTLGCVPISAAPCLIHSTHFCRGNLLSIVMRMQLD